MRPKQCLVLEDGRKQKQPVDSGGGGVGPQRGKITATDAVQNVSVSRLSEGSSSGAISTREAGQSSGKHLYESEKIDCKDDEERTLVIAEDFVNRKECTDNVPRSSQRIFLYPATADDCKR
jgi:hypothetical protein